jgi:5-formyltetrahydrofolate cyclo-ligase
MKSMLPKQKSYIPRFALLIHLLNNFEEISIPVLISKETVLKAFELSKYFIKQAQKVKVSAKETKSIASIVAINKELSPKEIFDIMLKKGDKINFTKVAEMLNVTRATLYSWSKSV